MWLKKVIFISPESRFFQYLYLYLLLVCTIGVQCKYCEFSTYSAVLMTKAPVVLCEKAFKILFSEFESRVHKGMKRVWQLMTSFIVSRIQEMWLLNLWLMLDVTYCTRTLYKYSTCSVLLNWNRTKSCGASYHSLHGNWGRYIILYWALVSSHVVW